MTNIRKETDSLGVVEVPADKLWGAQMQRSLEHFSIGTDVMPREMITADAVLKKAAATANHASKRLNDQQYRLIAQTCDEILAGQHHDMFPLHVWMTGSGTQFNMNVNEVISNRGCQLAGTPLGSKTPVHPSSGALQTGRPARAWGTAGRREKAVCISSPLHRAPEHAKFKRTGLEHCKFSEISCAELGR